MRCSPLSVGTFHFIGIGGIGMSGIAEILHAMAYKVKGSDVSENANVQRLRKLGIPIVIGHQAENIGDASVVVMSSAVRRDNSELIAARALKLPIVRRAEMLAELMRLKPSIAVAGSHGKTTTTSLLAHLMDVGNFLPTVISGGIINSYGTNARLGQGEWLVAEADESDGSFTKLPATIAVVTNIDPEHMDFYKSFEDVRSAFKTYIENLPFYGLAVLCQDHPEVRRLREQIYDRRVVTYGFDEQADVRATQLSMSIEGATFDIELSKHAQTLKGASLWTDVALKQLKLPMYGAYNVENALATFVVALELGIEPSAIIQAFATFKGVSRRFTKVGVINGVTIVDDYAHHPVEIEKVLKAASSACKRRVIAVVQPHRYSRLNYLFEDFAKCFQDAHSVIVAPVYSAGEETIEGIDHLRLAAAIKQVGHPHVLTIDDASALAPLIASIATSDDYVMCLGAGTITIWAQELLNQLSDASLIARQSGT
ncbi:MAG: UDP-N-acetylmuramate--L-alanine ligase [Alphaproteobacteria bacterium]|nr:UDP-N-acetylmuramate--L-alanine ligase [Alphaproteobacteria bacterium]